MHPGVQKSLGIALAFGSVWLAIQFFLPLFAPFLLGLGLALAAEPMTGFLHRRLRVPRPVSAGIGVSMAFCFFVMVLLVLCALLVRELAVLAGVLPDLEDAVRSGVELLHNWLLRLISHAPPSLRPHLEQSLNSLFTGGAALLDQGIRYVLGLAGRLLSHVPDSALGLGTAVISGFMISAKLPGIRAWLARHIGAESSRPALEAARRVRGAVGGWLLAQGKLLATTFAILLPGLWLLGISNAPLWALGICLVDVLPVLGTGTVLMPWALVCFLRDQGARALGLLGLYAVISLTRSMLEPRLLGRHLGLDPLVTLMAMYIGYRLWGVGGMILSPVLTVAAIGLIPGRDPGNL